MLLDNLTVIVTGANGALGRACVDAATAHGARVIEFDLAFDADAADRYVVDLAKPEVIAGCLADIGAVDALLNVAGGFDMGPCVHETDDALWEHLQRLNVHTLRNMVAAVVPGMLARGHGAIVNVGALSAREGQAHMAAYVAARQRQRLTESMARELRQQGINVNAVLPSIIDTPANRQAMPDADFARWVAPTDLAEVMCFLASPRARCMARWCSQRTVLNPAAR